MPRMRYVGDYPGSGQWGVGRDSTRDEERSALAPSGDVDGQVGRMNGSCLRRILRDALLSGRPERSQDARRRRRHDQTNQKSLLCRLLTVA